jgi:hypothetical protein
MFPRFQLVALAVCSLAALLGSTAALAQPVGQTSLEMLAIQGRWIRTDAPYVIDLSHAQGGSLQALYFNPKPIHVSKTDAVEQGGMVQVMIELQDVGYPGSTYVLRYKRAQDTLQGIYFHPASQQSYEVGFVRQIAK